MERLRTTHALALILSTSMAAAAVAEDCGNAGLLPRRVSLAWRDDGGLAATLVPGIENELRAVFEKVGVAVDWRVAAETEEARPEEILVLLLADPRVDHLSKGVMGAVHRGGESRRA